jgi:hypothetical protein
MRVGTGGADYPQGSNHGMFLPPTLREFISKVKLGSVRFDRSREDLVLKPQAQNEHVDGSD